jgi:phage/plasmid-associated DNA primase
VDCIVTERVAATRVDGASEAAFDTAQWCIAFADGVLDICSGRLLRDKAAQAKMQTQTVGYEYEVMMEKSEPDSDAWAEYDRFMNRIFSSVPEVRAYIIELLAASAANINLQVHFGCVDRFFSPELFTVLAHCRWS